MAAILPFRTFLDGGVKLLGIRASRQCNGGFKPEVVIPVKKKRIAGDRDGDSFVGRIASADFPPGSLESLQVGIGALIGLATGLQAEEKTGREQAKRPEADRSLEDPIHRFGFVTVG